MVGVGEVELLAPSGIFRNLPGMLGKCQGFYFGKKGKVLIIYIAILRN